MTQECNSISVWNWSEISLWSSRSTLSFSFSNIFSTFALRSNNRVNASFKSVWSKTHNFSSSKIGWIIISSSKLGPYTNKNAIQWGPESGRLVRSIKQFYTCIYLSTDLKYIQQSASVLFGKSSLSLICSTSFFARLFSNLLSSIFPSK